MKTTISINTNSVDSNGNIFDKAVLDQIIEQINRTNLPIYFQDSLHRKEIPIGLVRKANRITEGLSPEMLEETLELDIELKKDEIESELIEQNKSDWITNCGFTVLECLRKDDVRLITKAQLSAVSFELMNHPPKFPFAGMSYGFKTNSQSD